MRFVRPMVSLAFSILVFTISLAAQPVLHLKGRKGDARLAGAGGQEQLRSRTLGRRHWLIQFPAWPEPEQLAELRQRNVKILGYVPDFGFSISAADNTDLAGLGLHWIGAPHSGDKVSGMVNATPGQDGWQYVIVEFYPDVDMNDARAMLLDLQLQIQESPDLLDHHLLAAGTSDQIMELAHWDEVSYIFPASDELIQGEPVHACPGALTDLGSVGQTVLKVGEGWDGPGQNGADLNYAFINRTPKLPPDSVNAEVARAFSEWARHAKLSFTPVADTTAGRTIAVLFGSRSHGDPYLFDGPGGILAHTFYPYPVNPEPIAGDMHFDADENWQTGADVDLFSVALHEAGHALGLGHSDKPGAVMYPYYRQHSALTDEDIAALLTLYAAQDGSPAQGTPLTIGVDETSLTTADSSIVLHGSVSGGAGPIAVSWTSSRGFSGTASGAQNWNSSPISLGIGINVITVTARDAHQTQVVQTVTIVRQAPSSGTPASVPQLDILAPASGGTFNTAMASVSLSGTASAMVQVAWTNSRGGSGQASGTASWNSGVIVLQTGLNTITITGSPQSGASISKTLQVFYSQQSSGTGTAPPSLTIVSPALTSVSTSASSFSINGTARDAAGIAAVTWINSTGASGTATGTSAWSIGAIPLLVGTNTITVRATNVAGATAWRSVVVTRQ